jgi:drug/metabolite transporter (DMT)-like permease
MGMMARFYIVGYLVLLIFDTLAQVAFKLGAVHCAPVEFVLEWWLKVMHEPWVYVAIASYLGAFATYITILRHAPVGPAFAASHLEVVTVLLVSVTWLHEHLGSMQVAGSLLIMGGVVILGIEGSKPAVSESQHQA